MIFLSTLLKMILNVSQQSSIGLTLDVADFSRLGLDVRQAISSKKTDPLLVSDGSVQAGVQYGARRTMPVHGRTRMAGDAPLR
ncbi:hypothetical protein H0A73_02880 [Alcaligenaceae bacterium]|nr:hypothetical protein [Alcaligenaceae bacterium]